ncbi:PhzF family phenazine biosynthesis protein [Clostridium paraputrificum]|uniref:PhzF family phenazine biosynthesis protein n=1 Tax=Clostridium paraputrificum TaxID=29363 RepID=UPI003D337740
MENKIYIVDAFADESFKGNQAAVCPLSEWLTDDTMQKIAMENNLSETAFFKKEGNGYKLRWFTPEYEIDLCGHGTLASAYIIFKYIETDLEVIEFSTISGILKVSRNDDKITMEFPIREGERIEVSEIIFEALGVIPVAAYKSRDLMLVLEVEDDIRYLQPNMEILKSIDVDGIIVTAKGKEVDFVSRFFVPNSVINEDPVTGSAHCTLIPYWSKRLDKTIMIAEQLSKRGGKLHCELIEDKVLISGRCVVYLEGIINI